MRTLKHHVHGAEGTDEPKDVVPLDEGIKDLRVLKHHVHGAEGPAEPGGVVPLDEGIRICGS